MKWLMNVWWKIRGVEPKDYYRVCARCGKKGRDHAGLGCRRYKRSELYGDSGEA